MEVAVVVQEVIEVVRTLVKPVVNIVDFVVDTRLSVPCPHLLAMLDNLTLRKVFHRIPNLVCASGIHEVTHVNSAVVDELAIEVRVSHQVAEEQCGFRGVSPCVARVIVVIVNPFNGVIVRVTSVKAESKVGILGHPAPASAIIGGSPYDDIVAREVEVAIVEVHGHDVDVLIDVHDFIVFGHCVARRAIELLEFVVSVPSSSFQLLSHRVDIIDFFMHDFNHVDIFQTIIVGIDVVVVRALANVEHALVGSVEIDDGGFPSLPVDVGILSHHALDDSITHIETIEVVTGIAQHEALEVSQSRFLVGEEFVVETFRSETLVGIYGQCLQFVLT